MPLTLADILDLDVVRRGEPEVAAGRDRLDRPVRWVHISEQAGPGPPPQLVITELWSFDRRSSHDHQELPGGRPGATVTSEADAPAGTCALTAFVVVAECSDRSQTASPRSPRRPSSDSREGCVIARFPATQAGRLLTMAEVAELLGLISLPSCQVAVDYANELVHTKRLRDRLSGSAG